MNIIIIILIFILIAFNVADIRTTMRILKLGGHEENRLIVWFTGHFGNLRGMIIFKAALLLPVIFACFFISGVIAIYILLIINLIYCWVVLHNLDQLR